jgi:hypothetical protein
VHGTESPDSKQHSQQPWSFMWVIAVQSSKIVVSEENQSPNIFHLNFYINGDMNDIYSLGIDYAPFKMAYVSSLL